MFLGSMSVSGNPVDYAIAFFAGILISFTPCVYPLIPVSAAYIGARGNGSKLKGLALSLTYVFGIAVTYSALGLSASLTGKLFGTISSHPLTYIIVGLIIIASGLFMLDVFTISLPNLVTLPRLKKKNYVSAFFLGLASWLLVGPCTTPALGAILAYLAAKKNIIYGATLLFSFAFGMGFILILAGTFSSLFLSFPKSGKWMVYVKKACALILLGMGVYFVVIGIRRI